MTLSPHAAQSVVSAYAAATDDLSGDVQPDVDALRSTLTGAALQELQAEQLELKATGQTVQGRAVVSAVTVLDHRTRDGVRTARVSACVDSSGVRLVDSDGHPVSTITVGSQRALNLYDLRLDHGVWRVVDHTFPADTTC